MHTNATTTPLPKGHRRSADNELKAALIDPFTRWESWAAGLPVDLADRIRSRSWFTPTAITTFDALTGELRQHLATRRPHVAVDVFIAAATTYDEFCDRRATLRLAEMLTGIDNGMNPRNGKPIGTFSRPWNACAPSHDENMRNRVLTDLEDGLVIDRSLDFANNAAAVALLASGVNTAELHLVPRNDTGYGILSTIAAPGTCNKATCTIGGGHRCIKPRELDIVDWGRQAVTLAAMTTECCDPLLYQPVRDNRRLTSGPDKCPDCDRYPIINPAHSQSAILMRINSVLNDVGLTDDPTVKPLSIRNTAARRVADSAGIGAATAFLGYDSYDAVAIEIGLIARPPARRRPR